MNEHATVSELAHIPRPQHPVVTPTTEARRAKSPQHRVAGDVVGRHPRPRPAARGVSHIQATLAFRCPAAPTAPGAPLPSPPPPPRIAEGRGHITSPPPPPTTTPHRHPPSRQHRPRRVHRGDHCRHGSCSDGGSLRPATAMPTPRGHRDGARCGNTTNAHAMPPPRPGHHRHRPGGRAAGGHRADAATAQHYLHMETTPAAASTLCRPLPPRRGSAAGRAGAPDACLHSMR